MFHVQAQMMPNGARSIKAGKYCPLTDCVFSQERVLPSSLPQADADGTLLEVEFAITTRTRIVTEAVVADLGSVK
jgi:hypothetical protein